jgi:hypothetical protein
MAGTNMLKQKRDSHRRRSLLNTHTTLFLCFYIIGLFYAEEASLVNVLETQFRGKMGGLCSFLKYGSLLDVETHEKSGIYALLKYSQERIFKSPDFSNTRS